MTVRPAGPLNARIMIVGEAPGEHEERCGEPFVGASGHELTKMLHEAGIARSECFITNVARSRPERNDITAWIAQSKKAITPAHVQVRDKWVLPPIAQGIDLLKWEIEQVKPNLIIALGNLSTWALTGEWGVTNWRGSILESDLVPGVKVLPAYHPAAILRQWSWRAVAVHDFRRAAKEAQTPEITRPQYSFLLRPSFEAAAAALALLEAQVREAPMWLSVDIETRLGHIACIGIAWSTTAALCIPLMCSERGEGYWTEDEEVALMMQLQSLLTHPNAQVIGQNFLYDAQYFWRHLRYKPRVYQDTMISQHVAFPGTPKSLDYLSSLYCTQHRYWKDDGKEWNVRGVGEDALWAYNCEDCVRTYEVAAVLGKTITSLGLEEVHDFQQALFWPVLAAMIRGVRIDKQRRGDFALLLADEMAQREQWFSDVLGHPLNPKSPKQMQSLFYDDLRQPVILHRKSGTPTLDAEALNKMAVREPLLRPLTRRIEEYRSLGVFLSTFVRAPLDTDERMRCSFNITGAETYRFSSSENAFGSGTNLQNIPKGGEEEEGQLDLPNIRTLFIPDHGYTVFDTDLSSADLRVVVWEADEREMKDMLAAGLDPYTEIAKEFYKDSSITKKDPRRQKFKSVAHGTNYLGSARGLAQRLGLSVPEMERVQAWYFHRFPRIREWQEALKDQVRTKHFVANKFGYRRFYFDRIDDNVYREAAAWIPQSTVACYINRVWMRFAVSIPEVEVLLQVHDSLFGQFLSYLREPLLRRMQVEAGKVVVPYADPLIIPMGFKFSERSWGDCD